PYYSHPTYISSTIDQIYNLMYVLRQISDNQLVVETIQNNNHEQNTSLLLLKNKNYTNIRTDNIYKVRYAIVDDEPTVDIYSLIDNYFLKTFQCGINHIKQLEIMYMETTTILIINDGKTIWSYDFQSLTNRCVKRTSLIRTVE
ncbi:unnamed protein product, partial [Didymodactylos carnosus]